MGRLNRTLITSLVVLCTTTLAVTQSAQHFAARSTRPFCVQCGLEGGCFICEGALNGGLRCRTLGCFTCILDGTCSNPGASQVQAPNNVGESGIKFDADTIRQIAATQPRFAATLAGLNKVGGLTEEYTKVHWTPVYISSEDVEWWLKPEQESAAYFKKLNAKARRLNRRKTPLIGYDLTVAESSDSSLKTVKLQVANASEVDPAYSSLELVLLDFAKSNSKAREWQVKQWRVN